MPDASPIERDRAAAPRDGAGGEDAVLADLLRRIAGRDEAALKALYARTAAKLLGLILRIQRDRSLAEDVLQDVYLRIWHAAGSYAPAAGAPLPWLCAIARHRAIDGMRRKSEVTMPSGEAGEAYWERLAAPGGGEDAILDRDALMACLSRLDPTQRDCVVLAYCEGWSREELAARYGRPVNTVKTWLHRTLASLKSCLEPGA